jgi:hypothetical protein
MSSGGGYVSFPPESQDGGRGDERRGENSIFLLHYFYIFLPLFWLLWRCGCGAVAAVAVRLYSSILYLSICLYDSTLLSSEFFFVCSFNCKLIVTNLVTVYSSFSAQCVSKSVSE